jgi:hypothetical protein
MLPTIVPGAQIVVEPVAIETLRAGDIVLTDGPGRLLAHRIDEVRTGAAGAREFVLRGDNLATPDRAVPASAILGRVCAWSPPDTAQEPAQEPANDNWLPSVGSALSWLVQRLGRGELQRARRAAS